MKNKEGQSLSRRKQPVQQRSRERVELILESTRKLLSEQGIGAITTPNIAARANIPVSSIYQYFPNKKAILSALYGSYLEEIRNEISRFDTPENLELEWPEFFDMLFTAIAKRESRDDLYRELDKAFALYPELLDIDKAHAELVTGMIAGYIKALGSRWNRPRCLRLSRYLYCVNLGAWEYRSKWEGPRKETAQWEMSTVQHLLSQAFE